jgi:hypothetical protein
MSSHDCFKVLGLSCFLLTFAGCSNTQVGSISISPSAQALTPGQTVQFTATGTIAHGSHPATGQNVTNQVTWSSSTPAVATVSSTGLASAVGSGTTTITATMPGPITATAAITVTGGSSSAEALVSIAVLPSSITDGNLYGTGQFLAYGTFSTAPTVMDITNGYTRNGVFTPVTWISGAQTIFPVDSAGSANETGGLVTADGSGNADIYAVAANQDGSLVISPSSTFNCPFVPPSTTSDGTCNSETVAPGLLVTLTVFNAGLNTSNWLITAPSATGTPDVIHCGGSTEVATAGGSICTATYPVGTAITLTAPAESGVNFGGWSSNCAATKVTAAGPNTCTVTLGIPGGPSNQSVGAIFN